MEIPISLTFTFLGIRYWRLLLFTLHAFTLPPRFNHVHELIVLFFVHEFCRTAKSCWAHNVCSRYYIAMCVCVCLYVFPYATVIATVCTGILFVELNRSVFVILLASMPLFFSFFFALHSKLLLCAFANGCRRMHFGNWFSSSTHSSSFSLIENLCNEDKIHGCLCGLSENVRKRAAACKKIWEMEHFQAISHYRFIKFIVCLTKYTDTHTHANKICTKANNIEQWNLFGSLHSISKLYENAIIPCCLRPLREHCYDGNKHFSSIDSCVICTR